MHPDNSAATRTRPDPYSSRAFVSSHSRKLANAQTERSVAATSTVLVTESVLSSAYQHCYWMFLSRSPIATTDSRTRIDSYSSRAFVSSHSRKLANAQTERSVAATSAVLVTESVLSSAYQHCYWMFLSRSPIATTDSRTRIDSYLSRAFVSSHSRKLANAQTERSVAATSTVLVTESKLGSGYLFCYVTAENWIITIHLNFIAICEIILLISIVFL